MAIYPEISVIVPVYNVEKYLSACLESILNQTFVNFELILINDGSTDNSLEICEEYSKIDNRIVLVSKENEGQSIARNLGIDRAKGKYIAFVDSDDIIMKTMLQVLYKAAITTNSKIAISTFQSFYEDSERIDISYEEEKEYKLLEKDDCLKALMLEEKIGDYLWNKLFSADLFEDIRLPEGEIFEDMAIMYRLFEKAGKVVYIPSVEYFYRQHQKSSMGSHFGEKNMNSLKVINSMKVYFQNNHQSLIPYVLYKELNVLLLTLNDCITSLESFQNQSYIKQIDKLLGRNYWTYIFNQIIPIGLKIMLTLRMTNKILYKKLIKR